MKEVYPIIISKEKDGYFVAIPDFNISTQGESILNCIEMARDAIGLTGITLEDQGKEIPKANIETKKGNEEDIITYVDIDFAEYRKRIDMKTVKKNCTIPNWLNKKAEEKGINFSRTLTEALLEKIEE